MKRRSIMQLVGSVLAALAASTLLLSSCAGSASGSMPENTDPKRGLVQVWSDLDHINKRCDGTTLVYISSGGMAAIPKHPDCK